MLLLSKIFAVLGLFFLIVTYLQYGKQVKNKTSNPSGVTLILWLVEGILNCITYWKSVGDIWKTLGTIATPILSFYILIVCIKYPRFSKILWIEVISLILASAVGIFWIIDGNDEFSNILLQVIYFISFLPIAYFILIGKKENPIAWYLAGISYAFSILNIVCNPGYELIEVLFYGVNFVGNLGIIILIQIHLKKRVK